MKKWKRRKEKVIEGKNKRYREGKGRYEGKEKGRYEGKEGEEEREEKRIRKEKERGD